MALFDIMFPKQAAQLNLNARRLEALLRQAGLDDLSDPDLDEVVVELKAGRDIKASQVYCRTMGVSVGEGQIAIAELKQKLGL